MVFQSVDPTDAHFARYRAWKICDVGSSCLIIRIEGRQSAIELRTALFIKPRQRRSIECNEDHPSRLWPLFAHLVCTTLFCAPVEATAPSVHKLAGPAALKPLEMSIGGRTLRTPSASINDFDRNEYTSQWPGIYFRAAFRGNKVFFRVGKSEEILHIVVDHFPAIPLVKPEPGVYEVQDLAGDAHTVSIFVATESQAGPNIFGGLAILKTKKDWHRRSGTVRLSSLATHTRLDTATLVASEHVQRTKSGPIRIIRRRLDQ